VVCREPQKIIDGFAPEFERLVYAMLLAPWDERLDPAVAKHALQATETAAGIAAHMQHPPGKGNGADAPDGASAKAPEYASASRPLRQHARITDRRMPTQALYRADAYLRHCEAHVTHVDADGVELDQTVFYPLGGGQAGD